MCHKNELEPLGMCHSMQDIAFENIQGRVTSFLLVLNSLNFPDFFPLKKIDTGLKQIGTLCKIITLE